MSNLADPAAPFWTYADLAAAFAMGRSSVKRAMAQWEADGFPAPLPWSLREKRWAPRAVLAWKWRQELRARALGPPDLHIAS